MVTVTRECHRVRRHDFGIGLFFGRVARVAMVQRLARRSIRVNDTARAGEAMGVVVPRESAPAKR